MCFYLPDDTGVEVAQERLINLSFLLICLLLGSHLHIRTHCYSSTKQSCHHSDSFHISSRNQLCLYSSGESDNVHKSTLNSSSSYQFIHMTFFWPVYIKWPFLYNSTQRYYSALCMWDVSQVPNKWLIFAIFENFWFSW